MAGSTEDFLSKAQASPGGPRRCRPMPETQKNNNHKTKNNSNNNNKENTNRNKNKKKNNKKKTTNRNKNKKKKNSDKVTVVVIGIISVATIVVFVLNFHDQDTTFVFGISVSRGIETHGLLKARSKFAAACCSLQNSLRREIETCSWADARLASNKSQVVACTYRYFETDVGKLLRGLETWPELQFCVCRSWNSGHMGGIRVGESFAHNATEWPAHENIESIVRCQAARHASKRRSRILDHAPIRKPTRNLPAGQS